MRLISHEQVTRNIDTGTQSVEYTTVFESTERGKHKKCIEWFRKSEYTCLMVAPSDAEHYSSDDSLRSTLTASIRPKDKVYVNKKYGKSYINKFNDAKRENEKA